jgi:hypothetical protein
MITSTFSTVANFLDQNMDGGAGVQSSKKEDWKERFCKLVGTLEGCDLTSHPKDST